MIGLLMALAAAPVAGQSDMVAAKHAIGAVCGWRAGVLGPDIAGFAATRAPPITFRNGTVVVRQRGGHRFAFLVNITAEEPVASCRVADVVALPPASQAPSVLQCSATLGGSPAPGGPGWLYGVGVRTRGQKDPVGFWTVRPDGRKLVRVNIAAHGLGGKVRCQEPERGD